jgi:hypothetical protein
VDESHPIEGKKTMTEYLTSTAEAVEYLMAEGNFGVPCSRYGRDTLECAPIAWQVAGAWADESGHDDVTGDDLEYFMGLVVNDHDDVAYLLSIDAYKANNGG